MSNPFEGDNGEYLVLVDVGQYSLWPASFDIPLGWTATVREMKDDGRTREQSDDVTPDAADWDRP